MLIKKTTLLLIIVLFASLFLRAYKPLLLFNYSHDQDLLSWFVANLIDYGDIRLLGQETSIQGVFIGPLFYYAVVPFYLIFHMNPAGALLLPIIIGVFGTFSYYFIFKNIFSLKVGLTAAVIHAVSFLVVMTEREVVPTMPVYIWSAWFLYSLYLILENKQKHAFVILGVLVGLIWHINLGLSLSLTLVPLALLLAKKSLNKKYLFSGIILTVALSLPLFTFEIRNGFIQTKAVASSALGGRNLGAVDESKFDRVITLTSKNVRGLVWGDVNLHPNLLLYLCLFFLIAMVVGGIIPKKLGVLVLAWIGAYILFFTKSSIILSEYYLNGIGSVWILILAVYMTVLMRKESLYLGYVLLGMFIIYNFYRFFSMPLSRMGYLEKRALIREIKSDALKHDYPCIAISYITKPGYELGYRYLFRIENMHVNNPDSGSPVYSIIFPHSIVNGIDNSFGSLGLVYPDYARYNIEEVNRSCSGGNSNLTNPIFGLPN